MKMYRKKQIVVEAFQYGIDVRPDWFNDKVTSNDIVTHIGNDIKETQYYYCEIKTLEGVMTGSLGDFIIKGVNGEIYPCKPDIFKKTYDVVDIKTSDTDCLNFGEVIEKLKLGYALRRKGWNGKGIFVFMQIPSEISIDIVPRMQSLPSRVKDQFIKRVMDRDKKDEFETIFYSNQLAIVHPNNTINGWVPSVSDIFANDWVIV